MMLLVVNMAMPLGVLALAGFSGEWKTHLIGVVFGMFVGVVLLGLFRQSINARRANGRFADWRISTTTMSVVLTIAAWVLGAINLFIVCWEISRRFTE